MTKLKASQHKLLQYQPVSYFFRKSDCISFLSFIATVVIVSIIACAFTSIVHLTVKRSQRKIPKGGNLCSVNKVYGIVIIIIFSCGP